MPLVTVSENPTPLQITAVGLLLALLAALLAALIAMVPYLENDRRDYALDQGTVRNHAETVRWYRKAADQGYADAQYNLGILYLKGQGVPQNYAEAVRWTRKSADQGNAGAQYNLGVMYFSGQGVPRDHIEAVRWFLNAADQGHAAAQNKLGVMYAKGQGVPQNHIEAARWTHKAANQGHAEGQYNLGIMYFKGQGVPRNHAEGSRWIRKAAAQGHAVAKNNLGSMHAKSLGVAIKVPPRGRSARKSPGYIAAHQVTLPAPEAASAIMAPPLAAKPAKTMIKATPKTPKTETAAAETPAKPNVRPRVSGISPNTPPAIIAALPPAPGRADLRVQLGTVKSMIGAVKEAVRLTRVHKAVLGGMKILPVRADLGEYGVVYRLLAGPLSDRASADSLCRKLSARKQGCIGVQP